MFFMGRVRLASTLFVLCFVSSLVEAQQFYTAGSVDNVAVGAPLIYASRPAESAIQIEVDLRFTRLSGFILGTDAFSLQLDLVDRDGIVVQSQTESIGLRTSSGTESRSYSMVPLAQLDINNRYKVRAQLLRGGIGPGLFLSAGSPVETVLLKYYHFTNTASIDPALNVLFDFDEVEWSRLFAIRTSDTQQSFQVEAIGNVFRYDLFNGPAGSDAVEFVFTYELVNASTNLAVPTAANESRHIIQVPRYYDFEGERYPWTIADQSFTIDVEPMVQLDSVNNLYFLRVTGAHVEVPGETPRLASQQVAQTLRLLHFSGDLDFNGVATTFREVSNAPTFSLGGLNYVNTSLRVSGLSGLVTGWTAFRFGNDELLNEVRLMADGSASVISGEVALTLQEGIEANDLIRSSGDIRYIYNSLKLTPTGPVAGENLDGDPESALTLLLPPGLGLANDRLLFFQKVLLDVVALAGPVALDSTFTPVGPVSQSPTDRNWLYQEGRPYGVEFSQLSFDPGAGRIRFTPVSVVYNHGASLDHLESVKPLLVKPEMAIKPSNEQFYRFIQGVDGFIDVTADFNGQALVNSKISLSAGEFTPHFPMSGPVRWTGSGVIEQTDSLIVPESSGITGVQPIELNYHQSCPGAFCELGAPPVESLLWQADTAILSFTPDGGLSGAGSLLAAEDLNWGFLESTGGGGARYAHSTNPALTANFLMAGHALGSSARNWNKRSAGADYDFNQSPSFLLLSGYEKGSGQHERFGTSPYLLGSGDYPGLNFRRADFSNQDGFSRLGRPDPSVSDFDFTLSANSKYYVRPAGVSGVHQAQKNSFSPELTIYGYPFLLDQYGLSFLDSKNHESLTNGSLSVPAPSNFSQSFEELTLSCVGELEQAKLDPEDLGAKTLDYWNGSIVPKTLRFLAPIGDDVCNRTGDPVLALGVTTQVAHIDALLFGEMGFFPDGQIVTPADNFPVISRFQLPPTLKLDGPSDEAAYTITPSSPLYFNHAADGPAERGFVTFAGTQDVPFFSDILVQVMTNANADSSAPFDIVGGWPEKGWSDGPDNFFTLVEFDPANIGWPSGELANFEDYRRPSSVDPTDYTPVAKQSFFGVLDFSYPLKWNTSSRFYRSYRPVTNNLMVLSIEHQVDYLSAEFIEVAFGAQYDGVPQLNLSNMLFSIAEENIGAGQAFVQGVQQEVVSSIEAGIDGVAEMLNDRIDDFYAQLFKRIDDLILDHLYDELAAEFQDALDIAQNEGPDLFRDYRANYADPILDQYVYDPAAPSSSLLVAELNQLRGALDAPFGVVQEIDSRLADLQKTLAAISGKLYVTEQGIVVDLPDAGFDRVVPGILTPNGEGERDVVTNLVVALIGELVNDAIGDLVAEQLRESESAIQQQLDALLEQAEPTLAEVEKIISNLQTEVSKLRGELAVAGEIYEALNAIIDQAEAEVLGIAMEIRGTADGFLDKLEAEYDALYPTDQLERISNPFEEYPREEVTALLRQKLVDKVGAAPFVKKIQYTLKQYLYDLNNTVENTIENAFAEVNYLVKELISETVVEFEKEINPMLSDLSDTVGAGQIDGIARFRGDTLVRLRLDGSFQWQVPKPLEFRGYMEYLQLDSDGPGSCGGESGKKLTEVSMGALDIPLEWISPGMRADVGAKFSMLYDAASTSLPIYPVGLAGYFKMTGGELNFETFKITELAAAAAFGLNENYIAANARMILSNYEAAGGIFLGAACSADPILLVDPLAGEVLGDGLFRGAYAYGEAWIPVSEAALGIPASCMFRVSAGIGAGVFYFVDGPVFGGRMLLGASGEALCAVSIRGDVSLVGVKDGGDFRFNGRGQLKGRVGPCPLCLKFSKSAKVKYDNKWSVDL